MNKKEIIIAGLRKQLSLLDNVCISTEKMKIEIGELIVELEDESKLGEPVDYDYGSGKLKSAKKNLLKEIKNNIKILKKIIDSIEKNQKNFSSKKDSNMVKFEEE